MAHTTSQVAKIANVSVQSVRNYTREYGDLLSAGARGEAGSRLFDDQDVQIFCAIADLRKAGVPPADIPARIRGGQQVIDLSPHQPTPKATEAPQAADGAALAIYTLQRQIEALRHAQARQVGRLLWSHGVAFWLGMVTMGVVFLLVWWLVNEF